MRVVSVRVVSVRVGAMVALWRFALHKKGQKFLLYNLTGTEIVVDGGMTARCD